MRVRAYGAAAVGRSGSFGRGLELWPVAFCSPKATVGSPLSIEIVAIDQISSYAFWSRAMSPSLTRFVVPLATPAQF